MVRTAFGRLYLEFCAPPEFFPFFMLGKFSFTISFNTYFNPAPRSTPSGTPITPIFRLLIVCLNSLSFTQFLFNLFDCFSIMAWGVFQFWDSFVCLTPSSTDFLLNFYFVVLHSSFVIIHFAISWVMYSLNSLNSWTCFLFLRSFITTFSSFHSETDSLLLLCGRDVSNLIHCACASFLPLIIATD